MKDIGYVVSLNKAHVITDREKACKKNLVKRKYVINALRITFFCISNSNTNFWNHLLDNPGN